MYSGCLWCCCYPVVRLALSMARIVRCRYVFVAVALSMAQIVGCRYVFVAVARIVGCQYVFVAACCCFLQSGFEGRPLIASSTRTASHEGLCARMRTDKQTQTDGYTHTHIRRQAGRHTYGHTYTHTRTHTHTYTLRCRRRQTLSAVLLRNKSYFRPGVG